MGYFSQDPRMDFNKNSDFTLWNKKAITAWIQCVYKKIKNMIKNIFDYKKLNKPTFMDSPFAYVLLCQNQSVFLSRSGASGEMQRKSPSSPRILLKGRKYAGMTHPHSHSSFPLISLLENRDTDTYRAFLWRKKATGMTFFLSLRTRSHYGWFLQGRSRFFFYKKSWHF